MSTKDRGRQISRNSNRGISKSKSKNTYGTKKSKDLIQCYNCEKSGQYQNQCKASKKKVAKYDDMKSTNRTEKISDALILSVNSPIESWVLDSGASIHSCSSCEVMGNYVSGDFGMIYLADDEPLNIVGKGDVQVTTRDGLVWKLQSVRHILGLKRNLISVGQLDDEAYAISFVGDLWKITKGTMVVARGKKVGTLYMTTNNHYGIALAGTKGDADLWHCRLGHMSEKGMKMLCSKGKLPGLMRVDVGLCFRKTEKG